MKILVLGGSGMLGHQVAHHLEQRHEVAITLRGSPRSYADLDLPCPESRFHGVDATDRDALLGVLGEFRPEAVVNCVGIIKQRAAASEEILSLEVNSLLPHRLAQVCQLAGIRLVHFSTDCIYRGDAGPYGPDHPSDCLDLYGRTKFLGEVGGPGCLTLRSSIIGLELRQKASLVEWFLAQEGTIRGFRGALYSGITTAEMARLVERCLVDWPELDGVWTVASEAISKYDLLTRFQELLGKDDVVIEPDEDFLCDRRLDGSAFTERTGYRAPSWDALLAELAESVRSREAGTP